MRSRRAGVVAITALALLLAGCGSGGAPMSTPSPSDGSARPPFQTVSPEPSASPGGQSSVPAKRWAAILGDLSGRGVPTDTVELVSAKSVTWNDGSLGCPKPGQAYTQALVDGMQVIVSVAGRQYDYRFGHTDNPKLCER